MENIQDLELNSFLVQCKNDYFDYLNLKNASSHTISNVHRVIEHFLRFLKENSPEIRLSEFNHIFIQNYLNCVKNDILIKKVEKLEKSNKKSRKAPISRKIVSDNTIKFYLSSIKMFLNYISDNNDLLIDFTPILKKVKIGKQKIAEVQRFNENDRELVSSFLKSQMDLFLDGRMSFQKAIGLFAIILLYNTGMRASEVLSLNKEDFINYEQNYYQIQILGKGQKIRSIYIKKEQAEPFLEIIPNGKIFNFSYRELYNKCNRFLAKAGISYIKSGCHIFRHNIGDRLVLENVNLVTIQKILGHSDIKTTAKYYTRASETASIQALDKL